MVGSNLRTHPSVALQLCKGNVDLHGWVHSVLTGETRIYDFDSEQFTLRNRRRG